MERSKKLYQNIDWTVVCVYFLLVIFGWINIYAAVYDEKYQSIFDFSQRYGMQLRWIIVSVLIIVVIFLIDSKAFEYLAYPIYFMAILVLIGVLVFGTEINNSKSWIVLGPLRVQPAEFAKVATALAVARLMSIYDFKLDRFTDLSKIIGVIALPFILIILQNDTGSALVYSTFIIVLFREGLSPWFLLIIFLFIILFFISLLANLFVVFICLPLIGIFIFHLMYRNAKITFIVLLIYLLTSGVLLIVNHYFLHYDKVLMLVVGIVISTVALIYPAYVQRIKFFTPTAALLISAILFTFSVDYIFDNVLEKHQRTRINVVLGLESDPQGVEYNVNQSKIAIGSGEFTGKGFLQGTQTKFNFVPEQDTDFIFCTVGEEWGFLGTSGVLLLFGILLTRIVKIAERQKSKMNRIYAYAVASILFFHVAINVGMTIGLMPVIGIPLPFFSYGGSSLWAFTILLFILVRLDASRLQNF